MTLSDIVAVATAIGTIFTFLAIAVAAWQIRVSFKLNQTQFEDSLAREYRDLIQKIPVKALLNESLSENEFSEIKQYLYHHLNLSNDQAFLRQKGRVKYDVWMDWQDGIQSNLQLDAFKKMWEEIKEKSPKSFSELKKLEKEGFKKDPQSWH